MMDEKARLTAADLRAIDDLLLLVRLEFERRSKAASEWDNHHAAAQWKLDAMKVQELREKVSNALK